ncbi:MAG: hypothetical protein MJ179_08490 [Treponema sp.]|nr:hypothetical protein [Treponema sp.]
MKSLIKKITVVLVLLGISMAAFAQGNDLEGRYYKTKIDGATAEVLFLEDNICLLVNADSYSEEYMACRYLYVPAKKMGFMWEDEESYLDFYEDYITFTFDDAKGTLTLSMDGDSFTFKLVK